MREGDPMEDNFAPVLFRIFTPNLDSFRTHASSNPMLTVPLQPFPLPLPSLRPYFVHVDHSRCPKLLVLGLRRHLLHHQPFLPHRRHQ